MSIIKTEIRSGAYYDSVILMQLQRSLAELAGVEDAGVVMGTEANLELLEELCETMDAGSLCAMGGMTPIPVRSAVRHFPQDFNDGAER